MSCITSKERVLTALAGDRPDRVPFSFWMDRRLMEDYAQRFGDEHFRVSHYGADVIETLLQPDMPARSMSTDGQLTIGDNPTRLIRNLHVQPVPNVLAVNAAQRVLIPQLSNH